MKRNVRILGIALIGVAALLLPLQSEAACGSPVFFAAYSEITGTTNGPGLRSNFWMIGPAINGGNPAVGPGSDNGPVTDAVWIGAYPGTGMSQTIFGSWDTVTPLPYDGCPDPLGPGAPMAYSLSDLDGTGNMVYAVGCTGRTLVGAFFEFDFTVGGPGCTVGCAPIALVPAPKATITGTTRSAGNANITVGSPDFSLGFYGDGTPGCAMGNVITHYEIFKQEIPRDAAAPVNRDASAGWVSVGTQNIGTSFNFSTACGANCDVYVAVMPKYDPDGAGAVAAFDTGEASTSTVRRVGPSSTKVQAGPILANPPRPRIANPKKVNE